ncbi:protein kinase domain-containing protein [Calycomorphotria hydatis]|uniref:protein kinase domain-containing protein n=1 Tax=Calycomorphotria hydatis TaxID=2528027 RepID=UPI0018D21EF3|nr:SUMF1/EgtB/PvdO family nonheme iron enzyme [Calycomorphotria hydatis]
MDSPDNLEETHLQSLKQVLQQYQSLIDSGEAVDREEFLRSYPHLEDQLRQHFKNTADAPDRSRSVLEDDPATNEKSPQPPTASLGEANVETVAPKSSIKGQKASIKQQFGRYRILKVLGSGAMGDVFLAEDSQLLRNVALKVPKFDQEEEQDLVARFHREAQAAATLQHANICPVYDVGVIDNSHYMTMAYIEGRPLSAYLAQGKLQPSKSVAKLIRKLAITLEEAHSHQVIHRDLKPANIMVNTKGEPIVMDFGLASLVSSHDTSRITKSGEILGSPAYMSPEQVDADPNKIGPGCDIYSLGIILYQMLTGNTPFRGPLLAVLSAIATQSPQPPSQLNPKVDLGLEEICLKMISKSAADRHQSMQEVANDLTSWLKGKYQPTGPTATPKATSQDENTTSLAESAPTDSERERDKLARMLEQEISQSNHAALIRMVQTCLKQHDYDQALIIRDQLPTKRLSQKLQTLFQRAEKQSQRVHQLEAEITKFENAHNYPAMLEKIDELLALKPGHRRAKALREEHRQSRSSKKRKSDLGKINKDKPVYGWLEPMPLLVMSGIAVLLLVAAGSVYYANYASTGETPPESATNPLVAPAVADSQVTVHGSAQDFSSIIADLRKLPNWELIKKDPHRVAAERVLDLGGSITISSDNVNGVSKRADLPQTRFALRQIHLRHCKEITPQDMQLLGSLGTVQSMMLQGSDITDLHISQFHNWDSTNALNLGLTKVTDIGIDAIPTSARLRDISLAHTPTTGRVCSSLKKHTSLREVRFGGIVLDDPSLSELASMTSLHRIICNDAKISDPQQLSQLATLPNLCLLDLRGTSLNSEITAPALSQLKTVRCLNLTNTDISPAMCTVLNRNLPGCRILHSSQKTSGSDQRIAEWALANNFGVLLETAGGSVKQIPDKQFVLSRIQGDLRDFPAGGILRDMGEIQHLQILRLPRCSSCNDLAKTISKLTTLYELDLSYSDITAVGARRLAPLKQLERLLLVKCSHEPDGMLAALPVFPYLHQLNLSNCGLTEKGVRHLGNYNGITLLDLKENAQLESEAIQHLVGLTHLRFLILSDCPINDDAIAYFKQMPQLRTLKLYRTNITPQGAAAIQAALPHCVVLHESLDETPWTFAETESEVTSKSQSDLDAPPPAVAPFDAAQAKAHQQAWANHLDIPVEYENSIGMKLRLIPPGTFMMGSTPEEINAAIEAYQLFHDAGGRAIDRIRSESPLHKVRLTKPFYIGVTEVTQSQYEKIMKSNPSSFSVNGSHRKMVTGLDTQRFPVESVDWKDAAKFCEILSKMEGVKTYYSFEAKTVSLGNGDGYRLPTEAEWEFACRSGTTTRFHSGDTEKDLLTVGWFKSDGTNNNRTHQVGELEANAFGLFDMHGNVWEWTQDSCFWEWMQSRGKLFPSFYEQFSENAATDPYSPFHEDEETIFRGGAWYVRDFECRSSLRYAQRLWQSSGSIGFRVVLPVDSLVSGSQR